MSAALYDRQVLMRPVPVLSPCPDPDRHVLYHLPFRRRGPLSSPRVLCSYPVVLAVGLLRDQ